MNINRLFQLAYIRHSHHPRCLGFARSYTLDTGISKSYAWSQHSPRKISRTSATDADYKEEQHQNGAWNIFLLYDAAAAHYLAHAEMVAE